MEKLILYAIWDFKKSLACASALPWGPINSLLCRLFYPPKRDHPLGDPLGVPFEYLLVLYSENSFLLRKKVLYWRKEGRTYHFWSKKPCFLEIFQNLINIFSWLVRVPLEEVKRHFLWKNWPKNKILFFPKNFEQFDFFSDFFDF